MLFFIIIIINKVLLNYLKFTNYFANTYLNETICIAISRCNFL